MAKRACRWRQYSIGFPLSWMDQGGYAEPRWRCWRVSRCTPTRRWPRTTGKDWCACAATAAEGPIAEKRLSRRKDGRYEYRTKRGPTLVLSAGQLVKRLVALVPPRGVHLTCYHGVFA